MALFSIAVLLGSWFVGSVTHWLVQPVLGFQSLNEPSLACSDLKRKAAELIPGLPSQIYAADLFPDGTTFSTPDAIPEYSQPVPNLPAFCRFGAFFNTSSISRVQFEVWLPVNKWNERFAFVGNGGDAGGVNYPSMGDPLARHGFAVASTDAGHRGPTTDGTFVINNPETQIDFGYRAVHLSTVFAKNIVRTFYGRHLRKSYWIGCSSGGKQGLRELTLYPEDYDGVIAGSPAYWISHMFAFIIEYNLRNQASAAGHISASTWTTIHSQILSQCDELDGLKDSMITNPAICQPDFTKMGLTPQQVSVAISIFQNYTAPDGTLIFPTYSPGAEFGGSGFVPGSPPIPISTDYYKYQVLNLTAISNRTFTHEDILELLPIADATNPGLTTVDDWDISPFIRRGGKLITFVGMADFRIPAQNTIYHHERVRETLGTDPRHSFRFFTVPGMGHCTGGIAPAEFGGPEQDASVLSSPSPVPFDTKHNMVLALIDWVENGHAPDSIIGTKFNNDNQSQGIQFQRPLCPYPLMAQYIGEDANSADSFSCA